MQQSSGSIYHCVCAFPITCTISCTIPSSHCANNYVLRKYGVYWHVYVYGIASQVPEKSHIPNMSSVSHLVSVRKTLDVSEIHGYSGIFNTYSSHLLRVRVNRATQAYSSRVSAARVSSCSDRLTSHLSTSPSPHPTLSAPTHRWLDHHASLVPHLASNFH